MFIENEITIADSIEEVWNALIDPKETVKYMYGCEVVFSGKVGESVEWNGKADGVTYVSGFLLELDENKRFSYTTFDPNGALENKRENHLIVTFALTENDGGTLLQVSQGDYSTVEGGKGRYEETMEQGGWSSVLQAIKELLES